MCKVLFLEWIVGGFLYDKYLNLQCIGPSWVLETIGALFDLCWFTWRVFLGFGWLVVLTCSHHYVRSLAFIGLMFGGTLCHCALFTWELVDFTTKGHEMGFPVLTRPCLHLSSMVVWLKSHEGYTLSALSTIIDWVGASLLCCSPPLSGFVIFPWIIHGSLCVCIVSLRGFSPLKGIGSSFFCVSHSANP